MLSSVLTGIIAVLNCFVSKSTNRCWPFYQLLKKWKGFQWIEECEEAFQGGFVYVSCSVRACRECSIVEELGGNAKADLLYQ